jgi:hypothetical protein
LLKQAHDAWEHYRRVARSPDEQVRREAYRLAREADERVAEAERTART